MIVTSFRLFWRTLLRFVAERRLREPREERLKQVKAISKTFDGSPLTSSNFPSPDGELCLSFTEFDEFHQGAAYRRLHLTHHGQDVTKDLLGEFWSDWHTTRPICPYRYQPWSDSGRYLYLVAWSGGAIYSYNDNQMFAHRAKTFFWTLIGSNDRPIYLAHEWLNGRNSVHLVSVGGSGALNQGSVETCILEWDGEPPIIHWLGSSSHFFTIRYFSETNQSWIEVFETGSGKRLVCDEVTPSLYIGIDERVVAGISLDTHTLILDTGVSTVGRGMFQWCTQSYRYDATTNELVLSVLRPTGASLDKDKRLPVERIFVTLQLSCLLPYTN